MLVPFVLVVLMAVVQVGLVAYSQLGVTHLARESARALATNPASDLNTLVAQRSLLEESGVAVQVTTQATQADGREMVVVTVSYRVPAVVGLFEPFAERFVVSDTVAMLVE